MKSRIQILALALLLSLVSVIPAGCGNSQSDENKTPTESGITESLEERSEGGESSSSSTPTEKSTPEASSTPSAGDNSELRSENSISSSGSAEEQTPEDEVSPDQSSMINEISEGSNSVSETEESTVKASEVSTVKQDSSDSVSESESKSPEFSEVSVEKQESSTPVSKPESTPSVPAQPSDIPAVAESVKLNVHNLSLTVGDSFQLTAAILPADTDDQQLTWYWSDKSVVTINEQAVVTAVGAGTATITVRTSNGKQDTCKVRVKEKEQSRPIERSEAETSKPEESKQDESSAIDQRYAAYYAPYDWDAVIDDLRQVGEQQYDMTWEDSLWVRNRGREYGSRFDEQYGYEIEDGFYHGNCQFSFPVTNTESEDGERLRNSCLYMFNTLERRLAKSNEIMQGTLFKIVVEDMGINDNGIQEYWIYILFT